MSSQGKNLILYFANWLLDRKKAEHGGEVAGLPWNLFQEISEKNPDAKIFLNHAFWAVRPDGDTELSTFRQRSDVGYPRTKFTICSMNPDNDLDSKDSSEILTWLPKNHFAQYQYFASRYPNVKVLISIGGWARCGYFSEMAYTGLGRTSFIDSCINLIKEYPWISGIDIDWEYPGCSTSGERLPDPSAEDGDEGCPIWGTPLEDSSNFTLLLEEFRNRLDREFGRGAKLLTACAGASTTTILPMQDWKAFSPYLDSINLMTYDMAGVWDGSIGHATSLKGTKMAVEYLTGLGISENKICIGSPLYAIPFKRRDGDFKVGAPCELCKATLKEIDENQSSAFEADAENPESGWHHMHDRENGAAYLYNDKPDSEYYNWFLSYEDRNTLQAKLDYINSSELAGLIVWETSQDTSDYDFISIMLRNLNPD